MVLDDGETFENNAPRKQVKLYNIYCIIRACGYLFLRHLAGKDIFRRSYHGPQ